MIRDSFMCYVCRLPSNRVKLCNGVPVCLQCLKELKADEQYEYQIPDGCVKRFFFMDWMRRTGKITDWPA